MVHKFLEHGAVKIESGEGEKVYKRTTISITKAKKVEDEKTWVQRVKILRDNITETGKEWVTQAGIQGKQLCCRSLTPR